MTANHSIAPIFMITGAMAAGKTSVAQSLANRLDPSVHLRGDVFRRMIVSGAKDMSSESDVEAMRQLRLRYQAASETAKIYSSAGFNVVYQDVVIGPVLNEAVQMYKGLPLHVIVLCPNVDTIHQRERERSKTGYGGITVEQLQTVLESTPQIGLWIDSSDQTVEETTAAILANLDKAKISFS